jgi:TIR domain/NB-ARC domain
VAGAGGQRRDFFISYTSTDRTWAEWIAWQLEEAGWTTVLQAWDFAPGDNFVVRMREALEQADRTIALLSQAYLASPYATDEWTGAFLHDRQHAGQLLPARIEDCQLPRLLATRVYIDLVGLGRQAARTRLLEGVQQGRRRPKRAPGFPGEQRGGGGGGGEPRFPAHGPAITNLPARNPHFTGRSDLLEKLRARLRAEPGVVVTQTGAIHGLGGVGKTELALEFAHRYQADYDLIWWISAEQPTSVTADLATLAEELGIQRVADQAEMVELLFRELRGRERWLLVYDNAERPKTLEGLLPPGGGGRVLVTSRYGAWGKLGATMRLDVLAREEAVAFLARRTGATDQAVLDALAGELGDLPLALEEAAAYLEETGTGLDEYLGFVRERARELFGLDQPPADEQGDQRRVATVWSLSLERVHQEAPAAEALLSLCAFLAPDIPRELPGEQPQVLPDELAKAVRDPLAYNRMLAVVGRYSLATVSRRRWGCIGWSRRSSRPAWARRASGAGPRSRSACSARSSRTTAGRWRPGRPASGCCRMRWRSPGLRSGWGWPGRRPAGCWTALRPTCTSGASTGRPGRSPSREWRSLRQRWDQPISRSPGAVTRLAASCRRWGIWPAPGCNLSGRWRSARRPLAPITPTWLPITTTSAACSKPSGSLQRGQLRISRVIPALWRISACCSWTSWPSSRGRPARHSASPWSTAR